LVDAVRCVIEVQTAMAAKIADVPDDRRIASQVGVNIGDIIVDGDDIFGDRVKRRRPPTGDRSTRRPLHIKLHEDGRDRLDRLFTTAAFRRS
jgi:hypothetical protein